MLQQKYTFYWKNYIRFIKQKAEILSEVCVKLGKTSRIFQLKDVCLVKQGIKKYNPINNQDDDKEKEKDKEKDKKMVALIK